MLLRRSIYGEGRDDDLVQGRTQFLELASRNPHGHDPPIEEAVVPFPQKSRFAEPHRRRCHDRGGLVRSDPIRQSRPANVMS
jgi:hypothetical protein